MEEHGSVLKRLCRHILGIEDGKIFDKNNIGSLGLGINSSFTKLQT